MGLVFDVACGQQDSGVAQRTCRPGIRFQPAARRAISRRLSETVAAVPAAERGAVGEGSVWRGEGRPRSPWMTSGTAAVASGSGKVIFGAFHYR